MPRRGAAVCAVVLRLLWATWPAPAVSTAAAGAEPEHRQLLELSLDLAQQARFVEAKAALVAAAQLAAGGPQVKSYGDFLRWRMGLRQLDAAELDDWLGWRREPPEPEWAEVPSSSQAAEKALTSHPITSWLRVFMAAAVGLIFVAVTVLFFTLDDVRHAWVASKLGVGTAPGVGEAEEEEEEEEEGHAQTTATAPAASAFPDPDPALFLSDDASDDSPVVIRESAAAPDDASDESPHSNVVARAPEFNVTPEGQAGAGVRDFASDSSSPSSDVVQDSSERHCVSPARLRLETPSVEAAATRSSARATPEAGAPASSEGRQVRWLDEWVDAEESQATVLCAGGASGLVEEDCEESTEGMRNENPNELEARQAHDARVEAYAEDESGTVPIASDGISDSLVDGAGPSSGVQRARRVANTTGAADCTESSCDEREEDEDDDVDEWEDSHDASRGAPQPRQAETGGTTAAALSSLPAASASLAAPAAASVKISEELREQFVRMGDRTVSLYDLCQELGVRSAPAAVDVALNASAPVAGPKTIHDRDMQVKKATLELEAGHDHSGVDWPRAADFDDAALGVQIAGAGEEGDVEEEADGEEDEEDEGPSPSGTTAGVDKSTASRTAELGNGGGVHLRDIGDEEWSWGAENAGAVWVEEGDEEIDLRESERASEAFADAWTLKPSAWADAEERKKLRFDKVKPAAPKMKPRGTTSTTKKVRVVSPTAANSGSEGADEAAGPPAREDAQGFIYFGGGPAQSSDRERPRRQQGSRASTGSGRTWHAGAQQVASSPRDRDHKGKRRAGADPATDADFFVARATRFRPTGCYVRVQGTGPELFLPVEHMEPRTDAATSAIKDRVSSSAGKLLSVRKLNNETVTMLSKRDAEARKHELDARRSRMEESINVLRDTYDSKKWMSGRVSAVAANGLYVEVVEGKDAFVPGFEMPSRYQSQNAQDAPKLTQGQTIEFRVVSYNWQNETFLASMLSFEESVAQRRAARGLPPDSKPVSAPAAVAARAAPEAGGADKRRELLQAPMPPVRPKVMSKSLERLAARGFSVLEAEDAEQLNEYLRRSSEDKKDGKTSSKVAPGKAEKQYTVSIVRGMTSKVVGNLTLANKMSEKEMKDAALECVRQAGELKVGQDHKGVSITKNGITVKA